MSEPNYTPLIQDWIDSRNEDTYDEIGGRRPQEGDVQLPITRSAQNLADFLTPYVESFMKQTGLPDEIRDNEEVRQIMENERNYFSGSPIEDGGFHYLISSLCVSDEQLTYIIDKDMEKMGFEKSENGEEVVETIWPPSFE